MIGTTGTIKLGGGSAVAKHAEIFAKKTQGKTKVFIKPVEGQVSVQGVRIRSERELQKGQEMEIGGYRLTWR